MPSNPPLQTPADILQAALAKEKQAFAFYEENERHARIEMVRELLTTLKDEEQRHIRLIEAMLARIRLG